MASPTVRVASAAADDIQADNLPLSLQTCQHLVVAALVGHGATSFEDMQKKRLPLVADEAQVINTRTRGALPIWHRQLRDDVTSDRAGKALTRAFERLNRPKPSGVELDFLKLRVSDIVVKQIRQLGLFVYTQKLLFSPDFAATGMQVLKEMKLPELSPVAASVALATGHLPSLPSRNLKDHLQFLSSRRVFFGMRGSSFAEWVAKAEPVVVEFPAPNLATGRQCRSDHFTPGNVSTAQLGLGFFLTTNYNMIDERLHIVTPLLYHSHNSGFDVSSQSWRAEFLSEQTRPGSASRDENTRLEKVRSDIGGLSARLKVCSSCSEIYSNDRADLRQRCSCARAH